MGGSRARWGPGEGSPHDQEIIPRKAWVGRGGRIFQEQLDEEGAGRLLEEAMRRAVLRYDPDDVLLTLQEVAEMVHLHPTTVERLMRDKEIPGFKLGQSWRLSRKRYREWVDAGGGS